MTEKSVPKKLYEEFQSALERLEIVKRAMLNASLTTQEELGAFADLGAAFDKAAADCSRIAHEIAAL
jgi:hypothetical protein